MVIYIVGVPTAGKSTLARMTKKRFLQVNVVSFEAVRNGFMVSQPELRMGERESEARREILPKFLVEMAEWNAKLTQSVTVVEGSFAKVEDVCRLMKDDDLVICLGYGGRGLDEVAKLAIQKASEDSYLYRRTVEEFKGHFYDLVEDDQANLEFCLQNNVPYYDTAEERAKKLEKVLGLIGENMKRVGIG